MLRSVCAVFLASSLTATQSAPAGLETPAPAIRVTTNYVVLDVVVTDKDGKPVRDLTREDFTIKESGKPQKMSFFSFEERRGNFAAQQLPAGIYSNRPEFHMPPSGPLGIILIDGLNTSVANQSYARQQILRYLATQFVPSQQVAVYALTTRLIRLQDFTTDPALLRAAIELYQPQSAGQSTTAPSRQPSPAVGTGADSARMGPGSANRTMAAVMAFQQDQATTDLQVRMAATLEALRSLARIVGGQHGRKNLIWVSSGFPFALSPDEGATYTASMAETMRDPTAPPALANEGRIGNLASTVQQAFLPEMHRTATLLAETQTAIYPVDARALIGAPGADASRTGLNQSGLLMMGNEYGQSVSGSMNSIYSSLETMKELARQTGGRALVSRNDIDHAVAIAMEDGGAYYSLGYTSENKKLDGSWRSFKVEVHRPGLQVRHRLGYFAVDPSKKKKEQENDTTTLVRNTALDATMVYFDSMVSPPEKLGAKNTVSIRMRVEPSTISFTPNGDKRQVSLDFFVVAVGSDGKIVSNTGKTVDVALEPGQYEQVIKQGLLVPFELELAPGEYQIRMAVRDNRSGALGTVTAPLSLAKS
jgi:VWFA-related protein